MRRRVVTRILAVSIAIILMLPLGAAASCPEFVLLWGGVRGDGDGEFDFPRRLAVDNNGNVFVADRNNGRIQKFDNNGNFITKWGSPGSGIGQFNFPFGIDVDEFGNVYVVERNNYRVQKFDNDGNFIVTWGTQGNGNGQFDYATGLAVDNNGHVFVADSFNDRMQKFSYDGTFIGKWGTTGSGPGQFNIPITVGVDQNGNVYVGDSNNFRVQKFDNNGNFITQWGSPGSGGVEFATPRGISVDPAGFVYVVDQTINKIKKFTTDGTFVCQWGETGQGPAQFSRPEDIDFDPNGNAFVTDAGNNRIHKYSGGTVAVLLARFSAERTARGVVVRWRISDPASRHVGFDVYRIVSGGVRERLSDATRFGEVAYEFVDANAPAADVDYWLRETDGATTAWHGPARVPAAITRATTALRAARPNPFRPATTLPYELTEPGAVRIALYDAAGRHVTTLVDRPVTAGSHRTEWDGRLSDGTLAPAGVYFARMTVAGRQFVRKMVLVR